MHMRGSWMLHCTIHCTFAFLFLFLQPFLFAAGEGVRKGEGRGGVQGVFVLSCLDLPCLGNRGGEGGRWGHICG